MDYVSCTTYRTRGTLKMSLQPSTETTPITVLRRTTTSPDAGDTECTNVRNTQSTKNAGKQRFSKQRFENDSPGALVADIVETSGPTGTIRYQAAIAINDVSAATTVACVV